ncbi:zinc finger protein ZFP2 isoform X2 [Topomyia yanbarensis]|uniref:zinc finger protein ZFP2 isoform X2 n=1 Tax=Topomyia yanbarensis TaxID=2498891 RepID=UPI00273AE3AB|nr:zinc finger protein ZFP2 isoform X2 [Topomyia yanbarensis]
MCTKSLSCPLCCQTNFPNIDALRISLLKATSRPLKCPICADQLLGLDKLTIHLFGHSILGQEENRTAAVERKKSTITNSLKSVRKPKREPTAAAAGVSKNPYPQEVQLSNIAKCDICGDEFQDQSFLKLHTSVFHEFPSTPSGSPTILQEPSVKVDEPNDFFPCNMCPKVFRMKGSLKIHMRVVHLGCPKKSSTDSSCSSDSATMTVTSTTTAPVYQCYDSMQCNTESNVQTISPHPPPLVPQHQPTLTIATPNGQSQIIKIIDPLHLTEFIYVANQQQQVMERAITNASPPSVPSPGGSSDVPSPSQPSPQSLGTGSDGNKQWECDVCLKSFTTKYFLKKHKRLHTGEMPYSCQICGKSFTFQQSYHKHLLYHSDEKPHICTICGRAFKELSTLHNHERIHSGEKPFSCETCGKCFRQRVSYLVHRRIHTNTQPYKCTACDKSFRYKVSQRTHKCPAQPPGTVVRQTGDLLQKLLQSSAILPNLHDPANAMSDSDQPPSIESNDHSQEIKSEDFINRTLDELLKESYDKMGIGNQSTSYEQNQALFDSMDQQQHEQQDVVDYDGETLEAIDSIKLDLLYN